MPPPVIAVVESEPQRPEDWCAHVLHQALVRRRPLRTLVLSGAPEELVSVGVKGPCSIRFAKGGGGAHWRTLSCAGNALPFQMDVFDLVVLHEWVQQNDERPLAAVRRSMPGGSDLLVLGRARYSARRLTPSGRDHRSWRPGWLSRRLRLMGFVTKDIRGRGVAGLDMVTGRGWRRSLVSCSDRVALRARRSEARNDIRLVRFSTPKTVVGRGTAWESANREYPPQ